MLINKDNLDQLSKIYEIGGRDVLQVDARDINDESFNLMLKNMHEQLADQAGNRLHLQFTEPLTAQQCDLLTQYIQNNKDALAFKELSFVVDDNTLNNDKFQNLIKVLNASKISLCHFNAKSELSKDLLQNI